MNFWKRPKPDTATLERVIALEAEVRSLKRDLAEVEDKVFHWLKRGEKRAAAAAATDGDPAPATDGQPGPPTVREAIRRWRGRNGVPARVPVSG